MFRTFFALGLVGLLGACGTVEPLRPEAVRPAMATSQHEGFALSARFVLKVEAGKQAGSYAGRLDWQYKAQAHELLLSGPLGQGMAAIQLGPQGITVQQGNGQIRHATEPGSLIQETLGYPLPLGDVALWLRGRTGPHGQLSRDEFGRPTQLLENGWRISYDYDQSNDDVPARITLLREQEIELRLRIEDWQNTP